jgi:TRAP-type C4-dicarboxylate transport system substrate-binding protein
VNEKKWNSISAADRAAIMSISGEKLAKLAGKSYAEHELAAQQKLSADGMTIKEASPKLMAQLEVALKPMAQAWVDVAKKEGMANAEAALADFRADVK